MGDLEKELRRRLHWYLEPVEPTTVSGVMGVCLTGSVAAGFVDEYSDLDLTIVLKGSGTDTDPEALSETLFPESAVIQQHIPLEKYSFGWNDGHIDVDIVPYADLRSSHWDLETRWEYDNAEVIIDPGGQLESHLATEVAFAEGEQAELIQQYADAFLFRAQWDVHKACLRESFQAAHRAVTQAADDGVALLYLQDGQFMPRDKWVIAGLDTVPLADKEMGALIWEATRVIERNLHDIYRRVRALQSLWNRLHPSLVRQEFLNPESQSWQAPPDELCLID